MKKGELEARLPKHTGRWVVGFVALAWITWFVMHPFEAVTLVVIALFLVVIWGLLRDEPAAPREGKDRTFRHPPWT
jgi:hypothetical protein